MNWKFIVTTGFVIAILYFFGGLLQAALFIPSIVEWISPLGTGKYFGLALAIPIFFWFSTALGKIFSLRKSNRIQGLMMILGFFGVISIIQGMKSYGNMFDQETGAPMQVYVRDIPSGQIRILSSDKKFDPVTGQKTLPLTQEILNEMESQKRESWKDGGLREMSDMYKTISQ